MGKVIWARRDAIGEAISTIPSAKHQSRKDFSPPPTLIDDFDRFLKHDIEGVNYSFEVLHDWYESLESSHEPYYIRANNTAIEWKSKIGNSDMTTNFHTSISDDIRKGDMVVREDGKIFIVNWNPQKAPNCYASQIAECNACLTFTREQPEQTDEYGFLVAAAGEKTIVDELPCIQTDHSGRPDYADAQGTLGIHADTLLDLSLQWNPQTQNIHLDDKFKLGVFTYRVVNITYTEINMNQEHGVLLLNAKRVAGGGTDGND